MIMGNSVTYNAASPRVVKHAFETLNEERVEALRLLQRKRWVNALYLESYRLSRLVLEILVNMRYIEAAVPKLFSDPDLVHCGLIDGGVRLIEMLREESN